MQNASEIFQRQTIISTTKKYMSLEEIRIDIPIVDNKEFRWIIFFLAAIIICIFYIIYTCKYINLNSHTYKLETHHIWHFLHATCRMDLIARIEAVTLKIIKQISAGQPPCISFCSNRNTATESSLRKKNVGAICQSNLQSNILSNDCLFDFIDKQNAENREQRKENNFQNSKKMMVDFAMKSSRNKFILMMMIMSEAHRLLLTNTTKTKRSFYYDLKNEITKSLMPHQRSIDCAVNSVANLLECAPWDLSKFVKLCMRLLFN